MFVGFRVCFKLLGSLGSGFVVGLPFNLLKRSTFSSGLAQLKDQRVVEARSSALELAKGKAKGFHLPLGLKFGEKPALRAPPPQV